MKEGCRQSLEAAVTEPVVGHVLAVDLETAQRGVVPNAARDRPRGFVRQREADQAALPKRRL